MAGYATTAQAWSAAGQLRALFESPDYLLDAQAWSDDQHLRNLFEAL